MLIRIVKISTKILILIIVIMDEITGTKSSILETINILILLKFYYTLIFSGFSSILNLGILYLTFLNAILVYFHIRIRTCTDCKTNMNELLSNFDIKGYRSKKIYYVKQFYYMLSFIFHVILFMYIRYMMLINTDYLGDIGISHTNTSLIGTIRTFIIMLIPIGLNLSLINS